RLLRQIDRVVEHHDSAVPQQPVARGEGLVIELRVEQRRREVGAERTTHLYGADGTAGQGAAADVVDQFVQRDAEARLEQAAVADIAGQLDRHRATRAAHAVVTISLRAIAKNDWHGGQRQQV